MKKKFNKKLCLITKLQRDHYCGCESFETSFCFVCYRMIILGVSQTFLLNESTLSNIGTSLIKLRDNVFCYFTIISPFVTNNT